MGDELLPHPKQVRDLLDGLLGREVTIEPADSWTPGPGELACGAEMVGDDHSLLALALLDLPLTVFAGAAIGLAPVGGAKDMIKEKDPSELILANTSEVLNVLSAVWNVPGNPHTKLGHVHRPGAAWPERIQTLTAVVGRRLDLHVDIAGYGSGHLALIAV